LTKKLLEGDHINLFVFIFYWKINLRVPTNNLATIEKKVRFLLKRRLIYSYFDKNVWLSDDDGSNESAYDDGPDEPAHDGSHELAYDDGTDAASAYGDGSNASAYDDEPTTTTSSDLPSSAATTATAKCNRCQKE